MRELSNERRRKTLRGGKGLLREREFETERSRKFERRREFERAKVY